MDTIVVALISGGVTLAGVLIANSRSQAVTETKLDALTREVREHNNFARRMPVVEEQIRDMERRLGVLERKGGGRAPRGRGKGAIPWKVASLSAWRRC